MNFSELRSMTVIQLRKLARENRIVLGAGIGKDAMIQQIASALNLAAEPEQLSFSDISDVSASGLQPEDPGFDADPDAEAVSSVRESAESGTLPDDVMEDIAEEFSAPGTSDEKSSQESPPERLFQAAWHSPDSPQNAYHAPYTSAGSSRPAWQNTSPSGRPLTQDQRVQPVRPHSFGPRFGPAAGKPEPPAERPVPGTESAAHPPVSPLPDHRIGIAGSISFGPAAASPAPAAGRPASAGTQSPGPESPVYSGDVSSASPTLEELLSTGDFEEGGGVLELHPDGYGFLRSPNFMPSSRDIYVSMAQIRRFSLRTGDQIQGKIRPQREGDKYAALLYIDTVNGLSEEESLQRPHFDELTPVYPSRRLSLEAVKGPSMQDMRLIDLIAPLGFGQRGLILCPPDCGKRELLQHYANTISGNYPDVEVLILLIDLTPEDATVFRESVSCPVLASTFDQPPEAHLRLTEMVIERAMRLVEQQRDVVILVDSLTRLAKIYSSAAVQQGRSLPGMVNPASLLRAKRMFGAARAMKEGGSLSVIAAMDIASGNKVDDSVVEEFKGTANMELLLDQSLVRAGISPAINLQKSYTKKSDLLLNDQQKEGLALIRQLLGTTSSAVAIPQLLSMMEKTNSNQELLLKMKDWFALMNM